MKQFKPLGDRVLVKPNEVKEQKSGGGIIISESMTHGKKLEGEVTEIGTGIFSQSVDKIAMTVKDGNIVLYEKGQGNNEIEVDGEKYLLIIEIML